MFAFVDRSNSVDLLFKTLLCGTADGITPFWKVKPAEACKFFFVNGRMCCTV